MTDHVNRYWATALSAAQQLQSHSVPYCLIKTYGGCLQYEDGNVDIITSSPLRWVHHQLFEQGFFVSWWDDLKNRIYEKNKLMLTPRNGEDMKIHLHSSVGWHDLPLIEAEEVIQWARSVRMDGSSVRLADLAQEGEILLLHSLFEKYSVTGQDISFISNATIARVGQRLHIPPNLMERVLEPSATLLWRDLVRVWAAFYRRRFVEGFRVTRHVALHGVYTALFLVRRLCALCLSGQPCREQTR